MLRSFSLNRLPALLRDIGAKWLPTVWSSYFAEFDGRTIGRTSL